MGLVLPSLVTFSSSLLRVLFPRINEESFILGLRRTELSFLYRFEHDKLF